MLIVYQKEPHPGQMAFKEIPQPENFEQRCELAKRMKDEYELPMTVLVDSMEDQSRALFSDLPSPAFVIDGAGIVRDKFPWADAETIEKSVAEMIKADKKKKKSDMSPAIYVAIFLPLFVVILNAIRLANSSPKSEGDQEAKPDAEPEDLIKYEIRR